MVDLFRLPANIRELSAELPEGYSISQRLVEPAILIGWAGGTITGRLAASISQRDGGTRLLPTPSRRHSWVADGSTIRPLPSDAPKLLLDMLNGIDPDNLTYSQAISLLRAEAGGLKVSFDQSMSLSGQSAAEAYPETLQVSGLAAKLYPYQARGVQWMHETLGRTGGLILADEMGLGKTLQVIALLCMEVPSLDRPALIVCPTSLVANWAREFGRFASALRLLIHRGPLRAGTYRELQTANVVITTYDTMVNDISLLSSIEWSWLICDEAQAVKNPETNRRIAAAGIPRRKTIPMTGTPIENSLVDLWSLVDLAVPNLLGSRMEFETAFPDAIESAAALSRVVDPIILNRRVADVAADLPERIEIELPLELDPDLAEHYRKVREQTIAKYPVAGNLVATLQLQLVCAHPWLRQSDTLDDENTDIDRSADVPLMTPKMERTIALLRESFANHNKVIVFAQFNRIGDLVLEALGPVPNLFWGAINGSTPSEQRQSIVDTFSSHRGAACLVLNPRAAGTGLNITAATVVIHFTPLWNPALEAQASARAHRRGQEHPVTIYHLFYEDTVERVMIDRSNWKSALGNEIVPLATRDHIDLQKALDIRPSQA